MAAKRPRRVRAPSTLSQFTAVLESIHLEMKALGEGQQALRAEFKSDIAAMETRLVARIESLELAVREHSKDIRLLKEELAAVKERLSRVEEGVARLLGEQVRASDFRALEARVARLEAQLNA